MASDRLGTGFCFDRQFRCAQCSGPSRDTIQRLINFLDEPDAGATYRKFSCGGAAAHFGEKPEERRDKMAHVEPLLDLYPQNPDTKPRHARSSVADG